MLKAGPTDSLSQFIHVTESPPFSKQGEKNFGPLEDVVEKKMATHSSVLSWRIPRTEEPGGLQSMGSQRVGYDWSDVAHTHSSALNQSNQLSLIPCRSIVHRATQYSCVTSMSLSVSVTVLANNSKQWNKSRNRKMRKKNYYYWGLFYDTNNTKRFEKIFFKIIIFEWLDDGHIPFFCIFFYITKISTLAMYCPNLKNVI